VPACFIQVKSDAMTTTEDQRISQLLSSFAPNIVRLTWALQGLIKSAAPQLREEGKIGLKNITYKQNGVVFVITPYKDYISLHFYKGTLMSDPLGILEGSGSALRHINFYSLEDIQAEKITPYLHQALELDS
jgi:hypothetical protein